MIPTMDTMITTAIAADIKIGRFRDWRGSLVSRDSALAGAPMVTAVRVGGLPDATWEGEGTPATGRGAGSRDSTSGDGDDWSGLDGGGLVDVGGREGPVGSSNNCRIRRLPVLSKINCSCPGSPSNRPVGLNESLML